VHTPEEYDTWIASQQQATQAQAEVVKQTIAMNPANLSASNYLAPYAQEMGVKPALVAHLHHDMNHHDLNMSAIASATK
jgi:cytochrome c oxidase subunit II